MPEAAASAVPEAVSTPQYKRHSQAQTASRQETGQSQEFEIVAKKKKKKKNIQSEEGEPKLDPGLVFVGSGEKTQSPGVIVAESGGDPQPMPDEELTTDVFAVPPCPEEEGTSTELPQSDYETGSPCSHPRVKASEDNTTLGQLTSKTVGARPDYRGRWCAVRRGHPGRPKPSPGSSRPRSAVE
ncbi:UNVERIFIED_CONTAM: hypothetical protein FKN15_003867 [Acipenser sinensis]